MGQSRYTLSKISEFLNISEEQARDMLGEEGISVPEDGLFPLEEERKLRAVLLRRGQAQTITSSAPASVPRISMEGRVLPVPLFPMRAELPPDSDGASEDVTESDAKEESARNPETDKNEWAEIVSQYVIMIDTCSLMHRECGKVIAGLLPALMREKKKVVVPRQVLLELQCLQESGNTTQNASAREGFRLCRLLRDAGCLDVRGNSRDNFADNVFFVHILHFRSLYRILLITQDRKLTSDTLMMNSLHSAAGYPVAVMRITESGTLRDSNARLPCG